jgi:hypothetical protein
MGGASLVSSGFYIFLYGLNKYFGGFYGQTYFTHFRSGETKGTPGKVFEHIFACLESGRVYPDDEHRRSSIVRL